MINSFKNPPKVIPLKLSLSSNSFQTVDKITLQGLINLVNSLFTKLNFSIWAPDNFVCGTDGKQYFSECERVCADHEAKQAGKEGIEKACRGECPCKKKCECSG